MKKVNVIGLFLIVCGVAVSSMSALKIFSSDGKIIKKAQAEYNEKYDLGNKEFSDIDGSEKINNINIKLSNSDVVIGKSANDKISVYAKNVYLEKFDVSTDNDTLDIDQQDIDFKITDGLSYGFFGNNFASKIEILVPEKYYDEFNIDSDYGDTNISGLNCDNLNVSVDSGDITLSDSSIEKKLYLKSDYSDIFLKKVISSAESTIKADCGDVNVSDSEISGSYIELNFGDADFKNAIFKKSFDVNLDSGDLSIEKSDIMCDSKIYSDYGDVNVDLLGSIENYTTQIDVNLGDGKIDGKNNKYYNGKTSKYLLEISADCGDASVHFKK